MEKPDNFLLTTELPGVSRRRARSRLLNIFLSVTLFNPCVTTWLTHYFSLRYIKPLLLTFFLLYSCPDFLSAQVRIRIFANQSPESALFSIVSGRYELDSYNGTHFILEEGNLLVLSKMKEKMVVKVMGSEGIICDSVILTGLTGDDIFSLRLNGRNPVRQFYSGDLQCLPDMGTILFINLCEIESYIAGVVKSEGGPGKNPEYFKTQAIIARTYMYKYYNKHLADRFNLCDNTHCQAFNGIASDTLIEKAARETKGLVILGSDSALIISAFHSNCGGETLPSEDVWLTSQPYLRKVTDPYCLASRNAIWQKKMSLNEWKDYLKNNGYLENEGNWSLLNFSQYNRKKNYVIGSLSIPLSKIREDFKLRSSFFSVTIEDDSVLLKGRGYGHGVGLCQEGAMVMATKGYNYKQIIEFYYTGVHIADIGSPTLLKEGD